MIARTGSSGFRPAYLSLGTDAMRERKHQAVALLAKCRMCPRDCGVNRLADRWAACKTGRHADVVVLAENATDVAVGKEHGLSGATNGH
jgi:putative pyruvate formate lyase activating enzyme